MIAITAGSVLIAAAAVVVAILARKDAKRSASAADRSADAAERSAASAERSELHGARAADAAEEQVALARAEAERCTVALGLRRAGKKGYAVVNESQTEDATEVHPSGNFAALLPKRIERISAGSAVELIVVPHAAADGVVRLSWSCPRGAACPSAPHKRTVPL